MTDDANKHLLPGRVLYDDDDVPLICEREVDVRVREGRVHTCCGPGLWCRIPPLVCTKMLL